MQLEFFFSFRSSYTYLCFHRLKQVLPQLDVDLVCYPVFPPPDGPEPRVSADPRHFAYMLEDFQRHCDAYGLALRLPETKDTDWMPSHAGFYYAAENGKRMEYLKAAFACRFQRNRDLGQDETLRGIAEEIDLDPEALLSAAHDAERHEQVVLGMMHFSKSGMVGVPGFVVEGQKFWGNDRLEWVIRTIYQAQGRAVPELDADLLAPPVRI